MSRGHRAYETVGVTASAVGPRAVGQLLRQYPRTTTTAGLLLTLTGLAEGVGLAALLPLLSVAAEGETGDLSPVGDALIEVLAYTGLTPTLGVLLAVIVAAMAAKATLKILAKWQVAAAEASVTADLRRALIQGFLAARWPYFTEQPAGSLANAVGAETMRAGKVFTKGAEIVAAVILLVVYATLAVVVSWEAALLGALVGAAAAFSLRFLVQISKTAGRVQTQSQDSLISRLNDALYNIKPLKAMGREQAVMPLLDEDLREYQRAQRRTGVSGSSIKAIYEPIAAVALAILLYSLLVMLGLPFEELLFVAFLMLRTVNHVGKVQHGWQELQNHAYALQVVTGTIEKLAVEGESSSGVAAPVLDRQLQFEEVQFSYGAREVLRGFSLTVPARQLTAVVGASGVGKTTMVDLIIGLQQPDSGRICVDGIPLSDIDLASWRARIGYVPQDTVLFHDTVRANLMLGDDTLTDDQLEEALAAAGALEFVHELDGGLDSVVGEHGLRLSGGQRQRLAIARALVRNPSLLILDEATTALDPPTERLILDALERLRGRLTILAISHQEGVTRSADQIVSLNGPGYAPAVERGSTDPERDDAAMPHHGL